MSARKRISNTVGVLAAFVLGFLCFGFAWHMNGAIAHLEENGLRADAVVTAIDRGAKNAKTPVVKFTTEDGAKIEAKCMFQMLFKRVETGDRVTVLYDPDAPETVMIDHGAWNREAVFFLIFGGGLLLVIAVGSIVMTRGRRG